MVPLWDLLNHVTGSCNVRLHHDAALGCLQMIATRAIAAGEELVNCYGALSNGELLRRRGARRSLLVRACLSQRQERCRQPVLTIASCTSVPGVYAQT